MVYDRTLEVVSVRFSSASIGKSIVAMPDLSKVQRGRPLVVTASIALSLITLVCDWKLNYCCRLFSKNRTACSLQLRFTIRSYI